MGTAMKSGLMLGQEHMECGMGTMDHENHEADQMHFSTTDCCENEYISVETDDLFKKNVSQELATVFVATTLASLLYIIELNFDTDQLIPVDTSPPFAYQDFQVLHQVFLI
jgi:hypothetical protein